MVAGSFWRNQCIYFSFIPSIGESGGVITLCNPTKVVVIYSFRGVRYLGVKVLWKDDVYYIINVYSS